MKPLTYRWLCIVSVHCREEGCIGKYTPRGPRDFPRAGILHPEAREIARGRSTWAISDTFLSRQCTDSISDTCTNRHKLHAHIHGVHCMHAQAHKPNSASQPVLKQVCQCALCSVEGACIISHRFIALYGTHWVQPTTHPTLAALMLIYSRLLPMHYSALLS